MENKQLKISINNPISKLTYADLQPGDIFTQVGNINNAVFLVINLNLTNFFIRNLSSDKRVVKGHVCIYQEGLPRKSIMLGSFSPDTQVVKIGEFHVDY